MQRVRSSSALLVFVFSVSGQKVLPVFTRDPWKDRGGRKLPEQRPRKWQKYLMVSSSGLPPDIFVVRSLRKVVIGYNVHTHTHTHTSRICRIHLFKNSSNIQLATFQVARKTSGKDKRKLYCHKEAGQLQLRLLKEKERWKSVFHIRGSKNLSSRNNA